MADSRERGPSLRSPDSPSVTARLVGGLQWAITGSYLFLLGLLLVAWYLQFTKTPATLDLTRAFGVFVLATFAAGYVWVGARSSGTDAHARRIEVVVTLLVVGFLLSFTMPPTIGRLGIELGLPLLGYGVAYAMTLAVSYGLVYGLDVRFFLGSDPERLE